MYKLGDWFGIGAWLTLLCDKHKGGTWNLLTWVDAVVKVCGSFF